MPLGWFDHQQMAQLHGASWPEHRCAGWADTAAGSMDWLDTVPPCPCTLGQAYSEFGQWEHDPLCNMYNTTKLNCQFHQGAKHCVRLVQSGWVQTDGQTDSDRHTERGADTLTRFGMSRTDDTDRHNLTDMHINSKTLYATNPRRAGKGRRMSPLRYGRTDGNYSAFQTLRQSTYS